MSLSADFPKLKNNSLGQITQLMQLDKVFIQHTLQNLLNLDLIERRYFESDLNQTQLSELVLTENGKKFYQDKQMPGKPRKSDETFFFNSLSECYEKPRMLNKGAADLTLNLDLFLLNNEVLHQLSCDAMLSLDWVTPDISLEENGIFHTTEDI